MFFVFCFLFFQRDIVFEETKSGFFPPEADVIGIGDLALVGTDRAYVLDTTENTLKEMGPQGQVVRTFGRKGQGPSEFQRPTHFKVGQDSAWVFDSDKGALIRFPFGSVNTQQIPLRRGYGISFYENGYVVQDVFEYLFHHYDLKGRFIKSFGKGFSGTTGFFDAIALECRVLIDPKTEQLYAFYLHGRHFECYDLKTGKLLKTNQLPYAQFAAKPKQNTKLDGGAGQFTQTGGTPLVAAVFQGDFFWVLVNDEHQELVSYLAAIDRNGQQLAIKKTPAHWSKLFKAGDVIFGLDSEQERLLPFHIQLR